MGIYGSPENLSFLNDSIECKCGTIFASNYCPTCGANKNLLKSGYDVTHIIDHFKPQKKKTVLTRFMICDILIALLFIIPQPVLSEYTVIGFLVFPMMVMALSPVLFLLEKLNKKPVAWIRESITISAFIISYAITAALIIKLIYGQH